MKKFLIIGLIALMLCSSGCSDSKDEVNKYIDTNGNFITEYKSDRTVFPEKLPYAIPYNDTEVIAENVDFYQSVTDFSHDMFVIVTLDCSKLDESQIHWLRKSDLEASVYLTHEKNSYDFSPLRLLGSLLYEDTNEISFVFVTSFLKENRYDFSGSEVVVSVTIQQEELFVEGELEMNYKEVMHYSIDLEQIAKTEEDIPEPLHGYIGKWLQNAADSFKK